MPWGDRTGPSGRGPLTGRGVGFCTGFRTPGYMNVRTGRGMWFGRRRVLGRVFRFAGLLSGCVYLAYRLNRKNKK